MPSTFMRLIGIAVLLLLSFSVTAKAALSNIQYLTEADGNGGVLIVGFSATGNGPLTIPSTINNFTVTGIGTDDQSGDTEFAGQTGLTSVTIPNTVTDIKTGSFASCTNLTSVTIGTGVTTIEASVFADCSNLTSIAIPDNVTTLGSLVFYDCSKLASATIGNGVTILQSDTFENCNSLTSVILGNSITTIQSETFYNCAALTSVSFPASVTTLQHQAFLNCTNLKTAYFWGNAPRSMGGNVFSSVGAGFTVDYYLNATGFTSPTWSPDGTDSYPAVQTNYTSPSEFSTTLDGSGGIIISAYNGSDSQVYMPDTINGLTVTSVGSGAFYLDSPLTYVTLPGHITSIGGDAFFGCTGLTSISIPNTVTSIIAGAFNNCTNFTSVSIGTGVTSIGQGAFYGCSRLPNVTIPSSVTSMGSGAFQSCSSLTNAIFQGNAPTTMGGYVFDSVANGFTIDYYVGATGFTSPTWTADANDSYPATNLGTTSPTFFTTTSDGNNGLIITRYTGSASTVVIPGTINDAPVTAVGVSGAGTGPFQSNATLTSVTVPNGVTSIGYQAFGQCSNLASITLPNSLTGIRASAFYGCHLTSVTIPANVTSIGATAFDDCTQLTSAVFLGNAPTMGGSVFALTASGFTVDYYDGATGFTSPTWSPDGSDSYPATDLGPEADLFNGVVTGTNLKRSPWFGHYTYDAYPLVYEYYLGYEYAFDAGNGGVYLYDYTSGHFWYTQSSYFPYLYDFSLNTFLYYYHANTPHRHFYDYASSAVITE